MLNLFFTKESLSEDHSDSGVETCNNSQGNDDFFRIFQSNFTQEMRFFLSFGRTLNVIPLLAPSITSCYNVTYLSESTDQCIRVS